RPKPHPRSRTSRRTTTPARTWPSGAPRPATPRWKPGSRSGRRRSGYGRSAAGPTPWPPPRPPNAPPASGQPNGAGSASPRPPSRFERIAAERRAAEASKQLDRLGKVNPLALEEYEALTERHTFLATQLDDLRKTRRDLLTVVKEVDDRVQEVFASAYADTAR